MLSWDDTQKRRLKAYSKGSPWPAPQPWSWTLCLSLHHHMLRSAFHVLSPCPHSLIPVCAHTKPSHRTWLLHGRVVTQSSTSLSEKSHKSPRNWEGWSKYACLYCSGQKEGEPMMGPQRPQERGYCVVGMVTSWAGGARKVHGLADCYLCNSYASFTTYIACLCKTGNFLTGSPIALPAPWIWGTCLESLSLQRSAKICSV